MDEIKPIPEPQKYIKPISTEFRLVLIIAVISILSNLVFMYSLYNKPVVNGTPYTTRLVKRNSPLEACPNDVLSYEIDTKITKPDTILVYYRTWFDLTDSRTLVSVKEGLGDIAQYKNPISLHPPVTSTIPFALAGHVLEFDRGFSSYGSADYIFPMTVTIKEGCKK